MGNTNTTAKNTHERLEDMTTSPSSATTTTTNDTPSPPPEQAASSPTSVVVVDDDKNNDSSSNNQWPDNLYVETRDMAAVAFLIYTFGYILNVARATSTDSGGGLVGLKMDEQGHVVVEANSNSSSNNRRLARSFTPGEVLEIVNDNHKVLAEHFPSSFHDNADLIQQSLQVMDDRARAAASASSGLDDRPLTLVEFDDHHQEEEMVYGVAVDHVNRRITLAFRGTDNQLAQTSNWITNLTVSKTRATNLPGTLQDYDIWFHKGFYNYIFGVTARPDDAPDKRKYDEIVEDIVPLLEANPDYHLYVTGHSLGGALASIVALYLACDERTSNNHPVTCLTFAAPRVGNYAFRQATELLERTHRLRVLRIVNDKDSVPMLPSWRFHHAGFQIRLYESIIDKTSKSSSSSSPTTDTTITTATAHRPRSPPQVTYPKSNDSWRNSWNRTWGNSILTSLNLSYDHGEYRERIEANRTYLEDLDLTVLYNTVDLTGFSLEK